MCASVSVREHLVSVRNGDMPFGFARRSIALWGIGISHCCDLYTDNGSPLAPATQTHTCANQDHETDISELMHK